MLKSPPYLAAVAELGVGQHQMPVGALPAFILREHALAQVNGFGEFPVLDAQVGEVVGSFKEHRREAFAFLRRPGLVERIGQKLTAIRINRLLSKPIQPAQPD